MSARRKLSTTSAIALAATAALLLGIAAERQRYVGATAFEPFHADVAQLVEGYPLSVGTWLGRDEPVPEPALKLLKPNAIRSISFEDTQVSALEQPQRVQLVVVACKSAADMAGHWPPRCYPAHGLTLESSKPRDWRVAGRRLEGMEYEFVRTAQGRTQRQTVCNLLVIPNVGTVRDIQDVRRSAEDYQQRYLGAAQVQVVFAGGTMTPDERDEVVRTLLTPAMPMIELLAAGEPLEKDPSPASRDLSGDGSTMLTDQPLPPEALLPNQPTSPNRVLREPTQ